MASASRERDREWLRRELQTCEYQELLRDLQSSEHFWRQFETWAEVIAFMRAGTSKDPLKDEVLRPVFRAHRENRDPRWRTILLEIFWPGLLVRSGKERHLDKDDPDELWQTIVCTFLRVIDRLDVNRRPERLVQKVMNDTIHDLRYEYRRRRNRAYREEATEPERIEWLAGGVDGIGFEILCRREAVEQEISRLREHLDAGRISNANYLLLVATRVHGMSVPDYARDAGLDYEVAKKRRQRAEAAIQRFEEKLTWSRGDMSPSAL